MSGLFDWFFSPAQIDPDAGLNNMGLIGATLSDVGAHLNGDTPGALDSFTDRVRRQTAPQQQAAAQAPVSQNNLGLIGSTLRHVGAQLNSEKPRAQDRLAAWTPRQTLPSGQAQTEEAIVSQRRLQPFGVQRPANLTQRIHDLVKTLP